MKAAVSRMSSGTVEGCRRCNMLRRLPRRSQPIATSEHGWSQSSQQQHPCCIESHGGGHSSEKSPYVGVSLGARVLWEREGKGSSSWGGLNRMCMLFQKASLQACKPGQLEGGKSVCMPGSVPPLWLEFDCLFWND